MAKKRKGVRAFRGIAPSGGMMGSADNGPGNGSPMSTEGMMSDQQMIGPQPGSSDAPNGSQSPTPQEQGAYRAFMANVANLLYDKQVFPKVVQQLKSGQPISALAQAATMIVARTEDSAMKATQGAQVDPDILLNAGREVVGLLADVAKRAGIHDFSQNELQAAYLAAVDQYRSLRMKQGRLNPQAFQQDIEKLKQAQANGTLDQQYPQIAEWAKYANSQIQTAPAGGPQSASGAPPAPMAAGPTQGGQ